MYTDFVTEYPDYVRNVKMSLSRQKFHRWVELYAKFKYGVPPDARVVLVPSKSSDARENN